MTTLHEASTFLKIPGADIEGFYVSKGSGAEDGCILCHAGCWTILRKRDRRPYHVTGLAPSILVGGDELEPFTAYYNGEPVWQGQQHCVFKSIVEGWILCENSDDVTPGVREPTAYLNQDSGTWSGMQWWKLSENTPDGIAAKFGEAGEIAGPTLSARGAARNAGVETPTVKWVWARWVRHAAANTASPEPFGVYEPVAGAGNVNYIVGTEFYSSRWRYWRKEGDTLVRTTDGVTLAYDSDLEVWTNTPDRSEGAAWFEMDAMPTRTESSTLKGYRWTEGDAEPTLLGEGPVAFAGWMTSGKKETAYMAEVGLWR